MLDIDMNNVHMHRYINLYNFSSSCVCRFVVDRFSVYAFDFSDDKTKSFVAIYFEKLDPDPKFCRISFSTLDEIKFHFNNMIEVERIGSSLL